jgi:hypothetical protein
MDNKTPLMTEVIERLGNDVNIFVLEGMVSDVLDGVKEYRDNALGEFMAGAVAILYGELIRHKVSFDPSEIIGLAYDQLAQEEEVA